MKLTRTQRDLRSKLGQNTAEYMLLLLLIGGGSIVAFKMFGSTIINRFASVSSIVAGGKAIDGTTIQTQADDAATNKKADFKAFDGEAAP